MKMNNCSPLLAAAVLLASVPAASAEMFITPSEGYAVVWDGNEGDNFSPDALAAVPPNLANAVGATAFASSELGLGIHLISALNDGLYGNSNSWIGNDVPGIPFAGINLGGLSTLTSFAFGRDNGNQATDPSGGQLTDRSLGFYTIQITRVSVPDATTEDTGDAATGWETIATLEYTANVDTVLGEEFTSFFRHEFEIAEGNSGIQATGFRIVVPGTGISPAGTAIDEIELYGPSVVDPDKDGDGFDDTVEVALGFDPEDPLSTPESRAEIFTATEFRFFAAKNRPYRIESSSDMQEWTVIETGISGRGAEVTRLYSTRNSPRLYYRAARVTAP